MMQTAAIFIDAYRELNAKRLFWITMILSGLVVAAFAMVGINENGLRIIVWDLPLGGLNSKVIPPETFYKLMFVNLGIDFWLAWIAAVLALVSTAGIIPDFVSAGSIDLMLSKPISRLRLFLTKYATGLMFVALQVSVFCVASFLVLGIKGRTWEPGIFLAVPIVTIFFSYLYCICALLGLITRSTIASLLLTLLAWFAMFAVGLTENIMLMAQKAMEAEMRSLNRNIERNQTAIERLRDRGDEIDFDAASAPLVQLLSRDQAEHDRQSRIKGNLDFAHDITIAVKTVLPKTTETIALLERWLVDVKDLPLGDDEENMVRVDMSRSDQRGQAPGRGQSSQGAGVERELVEELRSRPVWWIVGTSLIFEAVVLVIASWIFCRRDY